MKKSMTVLGGALLLVSICCGCATTGSTFGKDRFKHSQYPYEVLYQPNGEFLSNDWLLDNFQTDDKGKPTIPKIGKDYMVNLSFDLDGDGEDDDAGKYPLFDLRFINKRNDGVIWIRTLPIAKELDNKDLRIMMRRFVEAMSGSGYFVVQVGSRINTIQRRFGTRILDEAPATISGQEAYAAVVEIVNLDQRELSPETEGDYVELVIVRTDFTWNSATPSREAFPVLLVVGHSNMREDFESTRPDFKELLGRLKFDIQQPIDDATKQGILACSPKSQSIRIFGENIWVKENRNYVLTISSPDLTEAQRRCVRDLMKNKANIFNEYNQFIVSREGKSDSAFTELPRLTTQAKKTAERIDVEDPGSRENTDFENSLE